MKLLQTYLLILTSLVFCQAQFTQLEIDDPKEENYFGFWIDQSDSKLIVSASDKSVIYNNENGDWALEANLIFSSSLEPGTVGGHSKIDGDQVIIAFSSYNNNQGAVQVYKKSFGLWEEEQLIPGLQSDSRFGWHADIQDDWIVVGAFTGVNPEGIETGMAYAYRKNEMGVWELEQEIWIPGLDSNGQFGGSVYFMGDQLFIGARNDFGELGAVYVYENVSGEWTMVQKIAGDDSSLGDDYSYRIVGDGNQLLVSSFSYDEMRGKAYLYENINDMWEQTVSFTEPNGFPSNRFGSSLAVKDDRIYIGCRGADATAEDSGALYVYAKSEGDWEFLNRVAPETLEESSRFGCSSALFEDQIVIGAFTDDDVFVDAGSVYIYDLSFLSQVADLEVPQLAVYPNPTMSYIHFDITYDQVFVYDVKGKLVFRSYGDSIDVSKMITGTYHLKLFQNRELLGKASFVKL